jgi:hypothetical protein
LYPENLSYGRDFLYLAGALLGVSAGLFLSLCKKRFRRGQKERRLTACICVLSPAFLSAAAAFVFSNAAILHDSGLLIAAACVTAAGLLAALFPEFFVPPLLVSSGACVVLAACLFLRYPHAGRGVPVTRIALPLHDTIVIEPRYPDFTPANYNKAAAPASMRPQYENYYNQARPFTLEYSAVAITMNHLIPIIGGQRRCVLLGLNLVDDRALRLKLYAPQLLEETLVAALLSGKIAFMDSKSFFAKMTLDDLELGADYKVYFDCLNNENSELSDGELYKLPLPSIAYGN